MHLEGVGTIGSSWNGFRPLADAVCTPVGGRSGFGLQWTTVDVVKILGLGMREERRMRGRGEDDYKVTYICIALFLY